MAYAKMLNKQSVLDRLKKIPQAVQDAVGVQLKTEVDGLVEAMQRAAPVGGAGDPHPGALRDSIHSYPTPGRPLSYRIIADARDEKGQLVGAHIEFGHIAANGVHVPAKASFFPTYRARKKPMRRRLAAAARKAIKAQFPS